MESAYEVNVSAEAWRHVYWDISGLPCQSDFCCHLWHSPDRSDQSDLKTLCWKPVMSSATSIWTASEFMLVTLVTRKLCNQALPASYTDGLLTAHLERAEKSDQLAVVWEFILRKSRFQTVLWNDLSNSQTWNSPISAHHNYNVTTIRPFLTSSACRRCSRYKYKDHNMDKSSKVDMWSPSITSRILTPTTQQRYYLDRRDIPNAETYLNKIAAIAPDSDDQVQLAEYKVPRYKHKNPKCIEHAGKIDLSSKSIRS